MNGVRCPIKMKVWPASKLTLHVEELYWIKLEVQHWLEPKDSRCR